MTKYYCEYCEKELCAGDCMVSIKDGDKIILVHRVCVPYMSGGIYLAEIEKKCGVEIIGNIRDTGSRTIMCKYESGELHCGHGPAVEWNDGGEEWWVDGELHRENGPAVIVPSGFKSWYFKGKKHREDGPAIEDPAGGDSWYIEDKQLTQQEWYEQIKRRSEK